MRLREMPSLRSDTPRQEKIASSLWAHRLNNKGQ